MSRQDSTTAAQRYNLQVIHVQQSVADLTALRSDSAYSRTRVRNYLGRHGLRGEVLRAEVDRITAGYDAALVANEEAMTRLIAMGERVRYPYDWPKKAMTRLMKRMFHGHAKRLYLPIMDEFCMAR